MSLTYLIRDWSLITGRGGVYKTRELRVRNFLHPLHPQDRVKLFASPLLKSGNFLRPPSLWLKLQATPKNYPKTFCAPTFSMAKTSPPPFHRGKTSHAPLPFCSPPLPVISDQSLRVSLSLFIHVDPQNAVVYKGKVLCFS